jgi:tetratricopeptide (TPR) repeat protein
MASSPLWRKTLTLGVFLASAPAFIQLCGTEALAAEEGRRVLKAREVDSSASLSEEYARMAEEKRLESIRRLKELLSRGVEGETKAEMMLRLADLYFQQGRYLYLKEMGAFDVKYEACFNDENCDLEGMEPDNSGSNDWQRKSIKLYESILRNYPRYARADQATFYLGSALQDVGDKGQAVEAFKKLVKLYPQSSFVPDSYVLIGEYFFDNDNAYERSRPT